MDRKCLVPFVPALAVLLMATPTVAEPATQSAPPLMKVKPLAPPPLLKTGVQAPNFSMKDIDGKAINLSDYRGKIVVLDFWATWCGICLVNLRHLAETASQNTARGVVVLAVNVWDTDGAARKWLAEHPNYGGLLYAVDPCSGKYDRSKGIAEKFYGVSGLPTQYVIGKDGRIVRSIVGFDPGWNALEAALKEAEARTPPNPNTGRELPAYAGVH